MYCVQTWGSNFLLLQTLVLLLSLLCTFGFTSALYRAKTLQTETLLISISCTNRVKSMHSKLEQRCNLFSWTASSGVTYLLCVIHQLGQLSLNHGPQLDSQASSSWALSFLERSLPLLGQLSLLVKPFLFLNVQVTHPSKRPLTVLPLWAPHQIF